MDFIEIRGHTGGMWTAWAGEYGVLPILPTSHIVGDFSVDRLGPLELRFPEKWFATIVHKRSRQPGTVVGRDWFEAMSIANTIAIASAGLGESWDFHGLWQVSDFVAPTAKANGAIILHKRVAMPEGSTKRFPLALRHTHRQPQAG